MTESAKGYPPCRRLRRRSGNERDSSNRYPPCRRLRSDRGVAVGPLAVIRRVGGLEVKAGQRLPVVAVIRRVDGLEVISFWSKVSSSDMVPPNVHVELKYAR